MNKIVVRYFLILFSFIAVLYPLWVRFSDLDWGANPFLFNIFPAFGLIAFSLLWLHAISGVFEPWLRTQIDFDKFVEITSLMIFVGIMLHPLLLLFGMGSNFASVFMGGKYIWLGIAGWLLLITYDIGKFLKKHEFFARHWNKILVVSTIGFLLTFFHSLNLGSDLQTNPLRNVWIFYGVTAILSTLYTYGFKRLTKRDTQYPSY